MSLHRKEEQEEIGLVLPNGRVVWPPNEYKGYPLDTPQARYVLLKVLKKSAEDLDFNEDQFLAQYRWATRFVTTVEGAEFDINDDDFFVIEITNCTEPEEYEYQKVESDA